MNSKKAKLLRKYVKHISEPYSSEVKYQSWSTPQYERVKFVDNNGISMEKIVKVAKGVPKRLDICERKIYQDIKKEINWAVYNK